MLRLLSFALSKKNGQFWGTNSSIMSKVAGIIMTILGFLISVFSFFLYRNSSVYLPYNPTDKTTHLSDVGLTAPIVLGLFLFVAGVTFLIQAVEDNSELRN
jgi:heme/copper-type cytochrome/quinol oxidase subunit 2